MEGHTNKLHIAMFPWMALGHMLNFLNLAKLIARKGHRISFQSTPKNIEPLPKLPPNLSSFIDFVRLPMPHVDHNLPDNAKLLILHIKVLLEENGKVYGDMIKEIWGMFGDRDKQDRDVDNLLKFLKINKCAR
ncbi:hypothetical protein Dsin_015849 [Dipteronia sinensis]|uniref:UDP-glycosyltransferase n=1 Tax=Dipteronia sinensis TaxID=43782 RepID=A0AAE0ACQ4_9ROSI|nr:hypothetical protein Dsin_015849 [Dipteronia sinensis]